MSAEICLAELFPGGIRCARTAGHDGQHNNVGEFIEWAAPLCWQTVVQDRVCILELGHAGPHGRPSADDTRSTAQQRTVPTTPEQP